MAGISGLLGTAGGAAGTGFSAPTGVSQGQLNTAQNQTQAGIQQQQNFVNQLTGTQGLQNQSNVFGQQQALSNQLGNIAAGQGPNPAMAQLAQATGANTANQAALMAGQRGSSQNAGLIARQAAQQGGANQQTAAGQGASMQAQQSLAAMQQQAAQQQAMQGVAGTQVAQQQAGLGQLQGASQAQQNALLGMQQNVNNANANLAQQTMSGQQGLIGGAMNTLTGGLFSGKAEGGVVDEPNAIYNPSASQSAGPKSALAQMIHGMAPEQLSVAPQAAAQAPQVAGLNPVKAMNTGGKKAAPTQTQAIPTQTPSANTINSTPMPGPNQSLMPFASGGKIPVMLSPGEQKLTPNDVEKVVKEGKNPLSVGSRVPGKPKYPGNDYRNDVVKDNAEGGTIIIPNDIMQGKNPGWESMKFVHAHIAKNRGK